MSQQQQPKVCLKKAEINQMIHRLKTRLALANFKRQYGFERYDLHTLESNLLQNQRKKHGQHERHRFYPKTTTHDHPDNDDDDGRHGTKIVYPASSSRLLRCPLSEKRSTSPQQAHRTAIPSDEDAANVLVMLRNMS